MITRWPNHNPTEESIRRATEERINRRTQDMRHWMHDLVVDQAKRTRDEIRTELIFLLILELFLVPVCHVLLLQVGWNIA